MEVRGGRRRTINEFSATPRLTIPASFSGDQTLLNILNSLPFPTPS